jgi:hypothetical protein
MPLRLDRGHADRALRARRSNGEFWSELVLLAVVALIVVAEVFIPVSRVVGALAEPLSEVAWLW